MMYKLLCVLKCAILVSSNPLQGLSSCPVIIYQRQPEPPATQTTNYQPYLQQHTTQNQLTPPQTIPYLYNDQIRGLYLDNVLTNKANSFVDANVVYDQNGFDVTRYVKNAAAVPNVVNNYIIVPPEYVKLNQNITTTIPGHNNKHDGPKPQDQYYNYVVKSNNEERIKTSKNNEVKIVNDKADSTVSKNNKENGQVKKKKKKKRKKYNNENNINESPNTVQGEEKQKPNKNKGKTSKKTLDVNIEDHPKIRQDDENLQKTNKANKKSKKKRKKSTNNNVIDPLSNEFYTEGLKAADFDVCFDINEDCTSLDSRRTRNNCYEPRNNYQQYNPMDFSANIAAYLNSFMSNQYGANFNPYGNFPFNLNYLYQSPQQSNARTNDCNRRSKNKKKKQKSNNNDSSNTVKLKITKNQDQEVRSNDCNNVVELAPEFIEIDPIEPVISKDITNNSEQEDDSAKEHNTEPKIELSEIKQPVILHPVDTEETLYVVPMSRQEEYAPMLGYNDLADEYYPDFKSDNVYVSKEDYESNFHNRHYYSSDSEAEMSRERRRYERVDGKRFTNIKNNKQEGIIGNDKQKRKDNVKNVDDSIEINFCTPPPLEYPDFKTKMINKHRYVSRDDVYHNPDYENYINDYEISYEDMKESKNYETNKNHESGVATVFGHSKVVRYGSRNKMEEPLVLDLVPRDDEEKNLFSIDGDTTFVIARSLKHPEG